MTVERYRMNAPNVIAETLDGEALIINLHTGFYYSIDSVGAAVWNLLCDGWSSTEVAGHLQDAFRGPGFSAPVDSLVTELVAEQLLVADPAALRADSSPPLPTDFQPPVLRKYTDMQGLLEADPIHEVEAAGWPHVIPAAPGPN
jgi:hypothetical protein